MSSVQNRLYPMVFFIGTESPPGHSGIGQLGKEGGMSDSVKESISKAIRFKSFEGIQTLPGFTDKEVDMLLHTQIGL